MKFFKRIWRYFFRKKIFEHHQYVTPEHEKNPEFHEVVFFEPVTPIDKFNKVKDLKGFLNKIDNKNE